ncbi:MAG: CsiV family protein [Wenzhouxiangella sp.]
MKIATLLLVWAALALPLPGRAEPQTVVRVEVIVFQHTDGRPDRWPAPFDDAFAALPDPQERARLAAWTARRQPTPARPDETDGPTESPGRTTPRQSRGERPARAGAGQSSPPPGEADLPGPAWPDFYVALPALSATMQQAHQRLEASPQYQVLTKVAWLQPLERGAATQPVRIRGNQALAIDWSGAGPTRSPVEPSLAPAPAMPEIRYRLDGSLHLRQRQFSHVDLDLVWSEPAPARQRAPQLSHDRRIHRLKLSRTIRLDRLEYFDSPWLGVLVRVEEWQGWP